MFYNEDRPEAQRTDRYDAGSSCFQKMAILIAYQSIERNRRNSMIECKNSIRLWRNEKGDAQYAKPTRLQRSDIRWLTWIHVHGPASQSFQRGQTVAAAANLDCLGLFSYDFSCSKVVLRTVSARVYHRLCLVHSPRDIKLQLGQKCLQKCLGT